MSIIGISGLAGSGKDTSADFLVDDHRFVKLSFADPLKRICRDVYDFTDQQLWGPSQFRNAKDERYRRPCAGSHEEIPCPDCRGTGVTYLTPREALQRLGTEWGRHCYPLTWAALAVRIATTLLENPMARYSQKEGLYYQTPASPLAAARSHVESKRVQGVVIPDVRFQNEIDTIKNAGGFVFRVTREGSGLEGSSGTHLSELEMSGIPDSAFDVVIKNDGTLDELRTRVHQALTITTR